MNYHAYEMAHAMFQPMRMAANALKHQLELPINPFAQTPFARSMAAACEVFENVTRRYGKPEWAIENTSLFGLKVPIQVETVLSKPFCNLLHFERDVSVTGKRYDPKVLIVAPMSGHYATLLRGTVEAMLPEHDVYVTDWIDARDIPVSDGSFDLDDFIDYLIEFVTYLGDNIHVMAVCQPAVPALAATAVMAANNHPCQPTTLTLMGGPVDTRRNPTAVNDLAQGKSIEWFEQSVISLVPFPNAGFMRRVYPGFMQLTGFMTMNLERHTQAHFDLFNNLVKGDCDPVRQHQKFYDEYLSVMDLPAEFYLQTIETVFQKHSLPDGKMNHRDEPVNCRAIEKTAILTIEGENDDVCGLGQTEAAHDLCSNVPVDEHYNYVQPGVGHYGVFNGTRWRTEIQPRIREFIRSVEFKRMTQLRPKQSNGKRPPDDVRREGVKLGLPYRALQEDREEMIEWDRAELPDAKIPPPPSPKPGK